MALKWYEWVGLVIILIGLSVYGSAEAGDNSLLYFVIIDVGCLMVLFGWRKEKEKKKGKKKRNVFKSILYIFSAIYFTITTLIIIMRFILTLIV